MFSGGGTDFSGPLSNMGQSIGRALSAVMSLEERAKKELLDTLSLEHAKLRNDYMQAQIDSSRSTLSTNSNALAYSFWRYCFCSCYWSCYYI